MKSWLIKFRISAALDSGKPLPPALKKALAASEELCRFEERARAVEWALREGKPEPEPVPFLHGAIMRRLTEAQEQASPRAKSRLLLRLAAPAVAVLLVVGLWSALKRPGPVPPPPSMASLGSTLEMGNEMTRSLSAGLLAPLSEELDHVNQDLDTTAAFLLASVP
jgi:hypothetical protein